MEKLDQNPLNKAQPFKSIERNQQLNLYVSFLNVRTLLVDTRITELSLAIKFIKWDIIEISENSRAKETIQEHADFILYHTSRSNVVKWREMEFKVKKQLKDNIVSFKLFSD